MRVVRQPLGHLVEAALQVAAAGSERRQVHLAAAAAAQQLLESRLPRRSLCSEWEGSG